MLPSRSSECLHGKGGLMPTIADAMDDVLREHLPNEVKRLNDAFMRLLVRDLDRTMVNILIESFCIHAHNLIEFFLEETSTPKGRNAVAGARHYVGRSYTAFEGNNIRAEESYEKLRSQVDHIRYGKEKVASQLQGPELTYLKRALDAEIKTFVASLPPRYLATWKEAMARFDPYAG